MVVDRYASVGKHYNRNRWRWFCADLSYREGRTLDALWLSGDQFEDLAAMSHLFRHVLVPEVLPKSYLAKKQYLRTRPNLAHLIDQPQKAQSVLTTIQQCARNGDSFDVVNLDYCTHFCPDTERTISALLRGHVLRDDGYVFMTVAKSSHRNRFGTSNEKVLAYNSGRIEEQIRAEVQSAGWNVQTLAGYPKPYQGRGVRDCQMLSFGWRLWWVTDTEESMKKTLSDRDKRVIVRLRKSGVAANIIADALEVTTGTIRALLAHSNRSSNT